MKIVQNNIGTNENEDIDLDKGYVVNIYIF